jgi:hypothetical protein
VRVPWTATIVFLLGLAGCQAPGELRLQLATAEPDPLADATALRLRFFDGSDERTVELPFDGEAELADGLRGEVVVDLRIEALNSRGVTLARGRLAGDMTPPADQVVEETVALLRAGGFSRIEGLEIEGVGADPCLVALGDGRLLIAGGGGSDAWLLDPDRGLLVTAATGLGLGAGPCQGAGLIDGRVVLAGAGDTALQVIHGDGYTAHESIDTGRDGGALAALLGGQLLWWMGGSTDGEDLTSERLIAGQDGITEGPRVEGLTLTDHRLACSADGSACAAVGGPGDDPSWWRVAAADVADAAGGYALEPLVHDGDQPGLPGRLALAFDDHHVLGLLEDDDVWLGLYDVRDDGELVWSRGQPAGLARSALASAGDGRAFLVGGDDGQASSGALWSLDSVDGSFLLSPVDAATLAYPRQGAAAIALADGRVVVAGGIDAGQALAAIEIYEPVDSPLP